MKRLLASMLIVACCAATVFATGVFTGFDPKVHGFKFANTFSNDFVPVLDVRTGGLCGGMCYAAVDYFLARWEVPNQDYRPANGTALQRYLYDCQTHAIMGSLEAWMELGNNPFGVRNSEFFRWGLDSKRIERLQYYIGQGMPAPLGLQGASGLSESHHVLAIGYDMGRYKADLGDYQGDFIIYIYDPNHPNETRTLLPDLTAEIWVEGDEKGNPIQGTGWQSWFVSNYSPSNPPWLPNPTYPDDGRVYELDVTFQTGQDDLRSWSGEYVDLSLNQGSGTEQRFGPLNASRWLPFYTETLSVLLNRPLLPSEIQNFTVETNFGGFSPDNWDMLSVTVRGRGGGTLDIARMAVGGPYRFTGSNHFLTIPAINQAATPAGWVDRLQLWITTGSDNLRGGSDNVGVLVTFTDGSYQAFSNINNGQEWGKDTSTTVMLPLAIPVLIGTIASVTIQTNFQGGWDGENWDMNSVDIEAWGNGVDRRIGHNGYQRFTGGYHNLAIETQPPYP